MGSQKRHTNELPYQGAILAAGSGSRMMGISEYYPKPLLPICNKPLIQYQIEMMKSLGILDIIILIGHQGYQITRAFGDGSAFGVQLRYVEQTRRLGIAHAVGSLEPHIHKPFLLFLGDIFFVQAELNTMFVLFEEQRGGGVLATKEENDPDAIRRNYSVNLSKDGYVSRVIEKPRYTSNRLKGVGLYFFDLTIFDAIRRTPRTAMRDEYELTDAIQVMIDDGYPVRAVSSVLDDINLTTPQDLLSLNLSQLQKLPQSNLVGSHCEIHPDAVINNCVIGSDVIVREPICISDSVIFDNTTVANTYSIENSVVTPDLALNCGRSTKRTDEL